MRNLDFNFFVDGGLNDFLPGPVKDLDQTGPLNAGKNLFLRLMKMLLTAAIIVFQ